MVRRSSLSVSFLPAAKRGCYGGRTGPGRRTALHTSSIVLARRPQGVPKAEDFALAETELPPLRDGGVLIANAFISMDAGVRGFLDDRPGYLKPVGIGEPVHGMSVGRVIESRDPAFPPGTVVRTMGSWSELAIVEAGALGLERIEPHPRLQLQTYMGALGPVGMTAWIGLTEIGRARAGETVLISAAAGATGGIAAQIARLRGCRVVGLAGSAAKVAHLHQMGLDAAIDYRGCGDLAAAIAAHCPDGVDVYYDNVGGVTLELVLPLMREQGRVIACGMIGDYNNPDQPYGVKTLWQVVLKRLTIRGFLTFDHDDRLAEAAAELEGWALDGSLRLDETVYEGLEAVPGAFIDLMSGRTMGKTLVRVGSG